ncbi:MAG: hypothetical protein Q8T08_25050 [Ignavibacteria bacterium]|nr:hypothetical protein [Ignavibacteria bacterium]
MGEKLSEGVKTNIAANAKLGEGANKREVQKKQNHSNPIWP